MHSKKKQKEELYDMIVLCGFHSLRGSLRNMAEAETALFWVLSRPHLSLMGDHRICYLLGISDDSGLLYSPLRWGNPR